MFDKYSNDGDLVSDGEPTVTSSFHVSPVRLGNKATALKISTTRRR